MPKAISPSRLAANRANAARSTGPRTPEGKTRSSQNARKHAFTPDNFAVVRIETPEQIADLCADAVDTYRPVNSQEHFALERIALSQQSMLRMSALEAGLFTNCLDQAMASPVPFVLKQSDLTEGIYIALGQHRSYWLAFGFLSLVRQSPGPNMFLRFQAQAERLYRHAVEDFDRLKGLRAEMPPPPIEPDIEPRNEPKPEPGNEPKPEPEPRENTPPPAASPATPNRTEPDAAPAQDRPTDAPRTAGNVRHPSRR